ncbi:restriction endonuclease, partial [Myxococcota bacterium]|nr:restriction endonuclease [Myxococcota bacterium]
AKMGRAAVAPVTPVVEAAPVVAPMVEAAAPSSADALKAKLMAKMGRAAVAPATPIAPSTHATPKVATHAVKGLEAVYAVLRVQGAPLSLERLSSASGLDRAALKRALIDENHRLAAIRAPLQIMGELIGLTEWGLSPRFLALEAQIHAALAEQAEILRRDLLTRVGDLSDAAFGLLLELLLSRQGYADARLIHQEAENMAFTATRNGQTWAILARRGWRPVPAQTLDAFAAALPQLGAQRGVFVTMGGYEAPPRDAALECLDGAAFAAALVREGVGARGEGLSRRLDVDFFALLDG